MWFDAQVLLGSTHLPGTGIASPQQQRRIVTPLRLQQERTRSFSSTGAANELSLGTFSCFTGTTEVKGNHRTETIHYDLSVRLCTLEINTGGANCANRDC